MLDGYKTWIGIVIMTLGWFGWGDLISSDQLSQLVDFATQFVGIAITIYGNYKAHQTIATLGRATTHCQSCKKLV